MIQQSAFHVKHPIGEFIGIVAFNPESCTAMQAAKAAWGEKATYKELDAKELSDWSCASGLRVFTCSIQ